MAVSIKFNRIRGQVNADLCGSSDDIGTPLWETAMGVMVEAGTALTAPVARGPAIVGKRIVIGSGAGQVVRVLKAVP